MPNNSYYTLLTSYGINLINEHSLNGEPFITTNWHVALGTGDYTPAKEQTGLVTPIFDKNSENYEQITVGSRPDIGRYAEIKIPSSLSGVVIREIGLFDETDNMVAISKTKLDLTDGVEEGLINTLRVKISLNAIPSDLQIIHLKQDGYLTTEDMPEILLPYQMLSEKGQASGYCPLNDNAQVDAKYLAEAITSSLEGIDLSLYAPIASPQFKGVPTAQTAPRGTATTQLATTAFSCGQCKKAGAGYQVLPSGLIIQWGQQGGLGFGTSVDVYFPMAFPNVCVSVTASFSYFQGAGDKGSSAQVYRVANNRFHVTSRFEQGAAAMDYIAIGW